MPEGTDKCSNIRKGYNRIFREDVLLMSSLRDLLKAGLISSGDDLVWKKQNSSLTFTAKVLESGKIETSDGVAHASPSMAARHVNMGISTNGWRVWQVAKSKQSLSDLRSFLNSKSATPTESIFQIENIGQKE